MPKDKDRIMNLPMTQDGQGKEVIAITDALGASAYYESAAFFNVVGDDVADGTKLGSITIADGETFTCIDALCSANASAMIKIVISTTTAVGGTETEKYFIDCQVIGLNGESKEAANPIFVYKNATGATMYALIYAPEIGWGAVDDANNDANHRFTGKLGGYVN